MTLNALATTHIGKGNRNKWASCFLVNNSRTSNWKLQPGQDQVKKNTNLQNKQLIFFFFAIYSRPQILSLKNDQAIQVYGKNKYYFPRLYKTNKAVAKLQQKAQNSRRFKIQLSEVLEWKIKVSVARKPKPTCCHSQRLQCLCTT